MRKIYLFLLVAMSTVLCSVPVSAESSLQSLINNAEQGSEIKLEAKIYEGNIVVNKPLTLIGQEGTIIKGDGTGNVIEITADEVTLDTLDIRHSGKSRDSREEYSGVRVLGNDTVLKNLKISDSYHGIFLNRINGTTISGVHISGHHVDTLADQGNGIHIARSGNNIIENSYIEKARDGIYVEYSNNNQIKNNTVTETRYGLHYMYSNNNHFEENKFIHNTGGAAIMHSDHILLEKNHFSFNQGSRSFGLIIQTSRDVEVLDNEFHLNQRGLYLDQSTSNEVRGNEFFHNQIGVELWTSSTAHVFSENVFRKNNADVITVGGESNNEWFKNRQGNDWGKPFLDLDQDGIADTTFTSTSALGELVEENELAYLFLNSPAITIYEKANEFVGSVEVMAEDKYPIMGERSTWNIYVMVGVGSFLAIFVFIKRRKLEKKG